MSNDQDDQSDTPPTDSSPGEFIDRPENLPGDKTDDDPGERPAEPKPESDDVADR